MSWKANNFRFSITKFIYFNFLLLGLPWLGGKSFAVGSTDILIYTGPSGETVFSDRHIHKPGYQPRNHQHNPSHRSSSLRGRSSKWDRHIHEASALFHIDAELIKAVIAAESDFDPNAKSHTGAQGLMQLMPSICEEYNVRNPFHPQQNILAGTEHLKYLLKKYKSLTLALAAYNAGESNVKKYRGIPPFKETKNYINKVLRLTKHYRKTLP